MNDEAASRPRGAPHAVVGMTTAEAAARMRAEEEEAERRQQLLQVIADRPRGLGPAKSGSVRPSPAWAGPQSGIGRGGAGSQDPELL